MRPFAVLDGANAKLFGQIRLVTPQLRAFVAEHDGRLVGPFAPELPKEWEIAPDEIAGNDANMSAGRYKPFSLAAASHDPPAKIIDDLIKLETRIQDGLARLLNMVEER